MKLRALVAILGLVAACAASPVPNDHSADVQPAAYSVQHHMQLKVVDDGSTYMRKLLEQVALDRERPDGLAGETERWHTRDGATVTDFFLTARSPEAIQKFVAETALAVPPDHELAFEKLDGGRWRSYLLDSKVELDATAIATAQVHGSTVDLEFTPSAAKQFAELT